ncbi:hypothetical protein GCM10009738_10910 [Kitasatospora viridis]
MLQAAGVGGVDRGLSDGQPACGIGAGSRTGSGSAAETTKTGEVPLPVFSLGTIITSVTPLTCTNTPAGGVP